MVINVLCENPAQTVAIARIPGISYIYSAERPKGTDAMWIQLLPYIMRDDVEVEIDPYAEGVLVRNYEELEMVRESHYHGRVIADASLYSFNSDALSQLKEDGITRDTVPYELNVHEMKKRGVKGSELMIYGRVPLMISANCLYLTENQECGKNVPNGNSMELVDRMNTEFPVVCDCRYCYNILYNSVPVSLHKEIETIRTLGLHSVRLNFTTESPQEAVELVEYYKDLLIGRVGETPVRYYTRGHFRKGVE